MDQRIKYVSKLSLDYFQDFLNEYFQDAEVLEVVIKPRDGSINVYFLRNNAEYSMNVTDFSLHITRLYDNVEGCVDESIPSTDDWLCYLRGVYGSQFVQHYVSVMQCEEIVQEKAKFLSQISKGELCQFVAELMGGKCDVKEVLSFYNSERRFLVNSKVNKRAMYVRLSDFAVIMPRDVSSKAFHHWMETKFGEEYVTAQELDREKNTCHRFIHNKLDDTVSSLLFHQ